MPLLPLLDPGFELLEELEVEVPVPLESWVELEELVLIPELLELLGSVAVGAPEFSWLPLIEPPIMDEPLGFDEPVPPDPVSVEPMLLPALPAAEPVCAKAAGAKADTARASPAPIVTVANL